MAIGDGIPPEIPPLVTSRRGLSVMADYHGAASEGTRAQNLMKKREKQKEELEKLKQKIADVSLNEYGRHSAYV